jgi:uncharacterized protein
MPNRLANETSPYLLQHAGNPVDWYAWGEEAFAAARESGKPILLSVGYSACHWCHVMAHESFEKPETAALMNDLFVNIKVDREERPDVDNIYMQAVQSMNGRGGWPMTVFLTEDGVPFYGGTYYPPADRQGMPGFPRVLQAVSEAYRDKRTQVEVAGHDLLQRIGSPAQLKASEDAFLTDAVLDGAAQALLQAHDDDLGGFGRAPKFPQPMDLDFLLRYHHSTGKPEPLKAAEITLKAMANGGMYDQAGGGFHRYSTDDVWLVPHFEKMLYDNALLARVYLDAFKVTGDTFYERITREILDYVLREMTDPSGGFYSTQDADSEGEEGKFFLWTPAELKEVLGEDAELIGRYFGVTEGGNFEGSNILHVPRTPEAFLRAAAALLAVQDAAGGEQLAPHLPGETAQTQSSLPPGESAQTQSPLSPGERVRVRGDGAPPALEAFEALLQDAKAKLSAAREQRVHPARDDKVLTAWNGLMQRAFAEAATAFDEDRYREAAARNAGFLLGEMRPAGRLLRSWKPVLSGVEGQGEARLNGYLEDYACLIDALLATHAATFDVHYLKSAVELADEMLELFWDEDVQGFFDTGKDHEKLVTRPRDFFDNATPSGTSVAVDVLLRLAALTDNTDYEDRATLCLRTLTPFIDQAPTAFGRLLSALEFYLARSQELAIIMPASSSSPSPQSLAASSPSPRKERGLGGEEALALLDSLRLLYTPNLLLAAAPEGIGGDVTPLLQDRHLIDGRPTAYVCERFLCQAPTTDPQELLSQVKSLLPR